MNWRDRSHGKPVPKISDPTSKQKEDIMPHPFEQEKLTNLTRQTKFIPSHRLLKLTEGIDQLASDAAASQNPMEDLMNIEMTQKYFLVEATKNCRPPDKQEPAITIL